MKSSTENETPTRSDYERGWADGVREAMRRIGSSYARNESDPFYTGTLDDLLNIMMELRDIAEQPEPDPETITKLVKSG